MNSTPFINGMKAFLESIFDLFSDGGEMTDRDLYTDEEIK